MAYSSETEKFRDIPGVMQYIQGHILDIGCAGSKITPDAIGFDGRHFEGVDIVGDHEYIWEKVRVYRKEKFNENHFLGVFDTVFSSHFLEHCPDQYETIQCWMMMMKKGGHLCLYLPDGKFYNNQENPEHMIDMNYDQFIFWFKRSFCGEGKDFRGNHLPKLFELVDSGMHIGDDLYSFYVIAKKV